MDLSSDMGLGGDTKSTAVVITIVREGSYINQAGFAFAMIGAVVFLLLLRPLTFSFALSVDWQAHRKLTR